MLIFSTLLLKKDITFDVYHGNLDHLAILTTPQLIQHRKVLNAKRHLRF